jgi:hypothetical protein
MKLTIKYPKNNPNNPHSHKNSIRTPTSSYEDQNIPHTKTNPYIMSNNYTGTGAGMMDKNKKSIM